MKKLGLDYETQKAKWVREGSTGHVHKNKRGEFIVAPIHEKKVHEMMEAKHHLRKQRS
jgi:hypothetical protein